MRGAGGLPPMDDDQIEDMWLDFSKKIRAGEVGAGAGGGMFGGIFGDLFRSRSAEGWMHLIMMAGMIGTLMMRRSQRNERKAKFKLQEEEEARLEENKKTDAIEREKRLKHLSGEEEEDQKAGGAGAAARKQRAVKRNVELKGLKEEKLRYERTNEVSQRID